MIDSEKSNKFLCALTLKFETRKSKKKKIFDVNFLE